METPRPLQGADRIVAQRRGEGTRFGLGIGRGRYPGTGAIVGSPSSSSPSDEGVAVGRSRGFVEGAGLEDFPEPGFPFFTTLFFFTLDLACNDLPRWLRT